MFEPNMKISFFPISDEYCYLGWMPVICQNQYKQKSEPGKLNLGSSPFFVGLSETGKNSHMVHNSLKCSSWEQEKKATYF